MKKLSIIATVVIICVVLSIFIYFNRILIPGMVLRFEKVPALSRSVFFISTFDRTKAMLMNITRADGLSQRELDFGRFVEYKPLSPAAIGVRPNGSRFYICIADQIFECDSTGILLRHLSVKEFELGAGKFGEQAVASNDRLWLSVGSQVIEWQPDKHPATRVIGPNAFVWCVDPVDSRVFVRGANDGIFDFDSRKFVERSWQEEGLFCDFARGRGLLLSGIFASGKEDTITRFDFATETKEKLPWGAQAQWSFDGYIYFVRGSTQLWRCKPTNGKAEPVYLSTRIARGGQIGYMHVLKFSADRTLLAYYYWDPVSVDHNLRGIAADPKQHGLVLIDLKAREYLEIIGEDLWPIENMAWLVKSDTQNNSNSSNIATEK